MERPKARLSAFGYFARRCGCCGHWVAAVVDVEFGAGQWSMCFACVGGLVVDVADAMEAMHERFPELPVVKVRDVSEGGQ